MNAPLRLKCSRCHRKLDVHHGPDATNQQILTEVFRAGWVVSPALMCPLDAAAHEAYERPVPRHRTSTVRPQTV